jgi:hypothetical protein
MGNSDTNSARKRNPKQKNVSDLNTSKPAPQSVNKGTSYLGRVSGGLIGVVLFIGIVFAILEGNNELFQLLPSFISEGFASKLAFINRRAPVEGRLACHQFFYPT